MVLPLMLACCRLVLQSFFGNENASSWKDFWQFVLCTHPLINRGEVATILDQDKGMCVCFWPPVMDGVL